MLRYKTIRMCVCMYMYICILTAAEWKLNAKAMCAKSQVEFFGTLKNSFT